MATQALPSQSHEAHPLRVGPSLDRASIARIRRAMELTHFKWDAQVGDVPVLAPFPLLVGRATWALLSKLAEQLADETVQLEQALLARPDLYARIALPPVLRKLFAGAPPSPAAARVMRFDFHYTTSGWRVSEVNSDVPGGFTEATRFAQLMAAHVPGARVPGDPTGALVDAVLRAAGERGVVALTNAPGHMEDHQVVAHLAAELRARGGVAHVVSPHHLRWRAGRAGVETSWCQGPVDAIVRFYQSEWLASLPSSGGWRPLFVGGHTPVANPGVAALSESKRLPLVWDALGVAVPTWRRLLPETCAPGDVPWRTDERWLLKTAYSNTGDTVSMREAMTAGAWARLGWRVRLRPNEWLAQRRFTILPLAHADGPLLPCVGVYTVDGRAAGAYTRLARGAIVDFAARDVVLLIDEEAP